MVRLKKKVSRITEEKATHAIKELVLTLYPGGDLGIRELGRRKEIRLNTAKLYLQGIAMEQAEKRRPKIQGMRSRRVPGMRSQFHYE